jgi:RNA polymerase sigma-70 factor (ECF subfamily)
VAEDVELADSVSTAMLLVLETLTPTERAVFVLREVFDLPYDEIAAAVDKTPAAVRQIAHRARSHVEARRPREEVGGRSGDAVIERFMAAVATGDLQSLNGRARPRRRPHHRRRRREAGRAAADPRRREGAALPGRGPPGRRRARAEPRSVNGQPRAAPAATASSTPSPRCASTATGHRPLLRPQPDKLARVDEEVAAHERDTAGSTGLPSLSDAR